MQSLKAIKLIIKLTLILNIFTIILILEKNSISENFIFSTGSKFIKNEVNCNLNDQYSSQHLLMV